MRCACVFLALSYYDPLRVRAQQACKCDIFGRVCMLTERVMAYLINDGHVLCASL